MTITKLKVTGPNNLGFVSSRLEDHLTAPVLDVKRLAIAYEQFMKHGAKLAAIRHDDPAWAAAREEARMWAINLRDIQVKLEVELIGPATLGDYL